jgi:hypothetical protein
MKSAQTLLRTSRQLYLGRICIRDRSMGLVASCLWVTESKRSKNNQRPDQCSALDLMTNRSQDLSLLIHSRAFTPLAIPRHLFQPPGSGDIAG